MKVGNCRVAQAGILPCRQNWSANRLGILIPILTRLTSVADLAALSNTLRCYTAPTIHKMTDACPGQLACQTLSLS